MSDEIEKEIDHESTSNIVCPYCGWEDMDSWEFGEQDGEMQCGSCKKSFDVEPYVSISYTTSRKKCKDGCKEFIEDHYFISSHRKDFCHVEDKLENEDEKDLFWFLNKKCKECHDPKHLEDVLTPEETEQVKDGKRYIMKYAGKHA